MLNMNVLYREKVPMLVFVIAMLAITALIFLSILISSYFGKSIEMNNTVSFFIFVAFLIDLLVLISFRELKIIISEEKIIFGFAGFKKYFYINQIKKIEISEYKFVNYGGYGIRIGRDGSIGYVPRGGKGLQLTIEGEKRKYFFSTNNPEQIKDLLLQFGAK